MVFSSTEFLFVFLPVFFLLYFALRNRTYRNMLILASSLFFYAWGEHLYVFLMIFFVGFNWLCAMMIDRKLSPKLVVTVCVVVNLGLIGYYKYADFFISSVNSLFQTQIPLLRIPLPLGISFFTFQTLSYVIDVYRRDVAAQKNPLLLGEYVACFPQLIAGPIVRYKTVAREITERDVDLSDFACGLRRFVVGLGKKAIIANTMASVCDGIFASKDPTQYGGLGAWLGIICYALQLYFDFGGYSDMAIGMGRMMGFHFLENFEYPFISRSMTEFWRRWHISLGTFFRDYLYIPLGGNRVSKGRWLMNLVIVWALTGLWHGAGINFVMWGLFSGAMLIVEKLWLGKYIEHWPGVARHAYTLVVFSLGLAIFRMETLLGGWELIKTMAFANGAGSWSFLVSRQVFQMKYMLLIPVAMLLSTPAPGRLAARMGKTVAGSALCDLGTVAVYLASAFSLIVSNYNPFIYFRF